MRSFLVCFVAFALVGTAFGIACTPNFCATVRCAMTEVAVQECLSRGEVGQFKYDLKGGFCGCCPACIRNLKEGENCAATMLLGVTRNVVCAEGLNCNFQTRVCEKTL